MIGSVNAIITQPLLGSVQVSSLVGALPAGTNIIGSTIIQVGKDSTAIIGSTMTRITDSLPVGANFIGSIYARVISINAGTTNIGSVNARISDSPPSWTGIGSVYTSLDTIGSRVAFDWTTALTGSCLWTPTVGNRIGITDIFLSSSGANLVTLFFGPTDDTTSRICKSSLVAGGGFVSNFLKPLYGHTNGSVCITTTVAVPGYVTINGFEKV
jgi:hypothetical protein